MKCKSNDYLGLYNLYLLIFQEQKCNIMIESPIELTFL